MDCPFCAESVKDEALHCRHCSQNIAPLKPLQLRVHELEAERDAAIESLAKLERWQAGQIPTTTTRPAKRFRRRIFVYYLSRSYWNSFLAMLGAGIAGVIISSRLDGPNTQVFDAAYLATIPVVGFVVVPLLTGAWLGLAYDGAPLGKVALIGAPFGVFVGVLVALFAASLSFIDWALWSIAFAAAIVGPVSAVSGRLIGNAIGRRWRHLPPSAAGTATQLARHWVPRSRDGKRDAKRVERLAKTLSALAPAFGVLTAVISGYFAYATALATAAAKVAK